MYRTGTDRCHHPLILSGVSLAPENCAAGSSTQCEQDIEAALDEVLKHVSKPSAKPQSRAEVPGEVVAHSVVWKPNVVVPQRRSREVVDVTDIKELLAHLQNNSTERITHAKRRAHPNYIKQNANWPRRLHRGAPSRATSWGLEKQREFTLLIKRPISEDSAPRSHLCCRSSDVVSTFGEFGEAPTSASQRKPFLEKTRAPASDHPTGPGCKSHTARDTIMSEPQG
ncbi:uncharacterized protein B0I36DRAFT_354108 [Microdochium trichocladiopsis]|uniref:Uncharacterized protein n=1 Tax=Microdochium trichocladiopsis TaxID=1682393 RepID=A0A9P8XXY0_9PEZI|nr:uncharacterized protein B0I36DRAFT_354108 [Microdochium trichocladiopsis]KAH7021452.1 hypothetical protein B0I36DRAFT_354108 [Microdochium trichocladiopsis]